ncbi:MAG: patatin-like phospholipase family protein [Myxococcota bacterium]
MGEIVQLRVTSWPQASDGAEAPALRESLLQFKAADGSHFIDAVELPRLAALGIESEIVRRIPVATLPVRFHQASPAEVADPPPIEARTAVLARLLSEDRASSEVHVRYLGRNRSVPPDGFVQDCAGGGRSYVWQVIPSEAFVRRPEIQERFSALRRHFMSPDTRVVLSLGSGGVKLFAHATALRLLEMLDCAPHIDEIWGSSAGAVVGLLYSHGLSPQAIEQSGYDLYSGRFDLAIRPTKFQLLRHLIRDTIIPSDGPDAAGFVDCAQGLSRMLDQYCASFRTRRPFYCIAFNLRECRPEVLTPVEVPEHLADLLVHTDAREAALASSTVPLLFVPRTIERDGEKTPYVDGSTTEDVPLYSPVLKWDRDRAAGAESRRRLLILYVKLTGGVAQYRSFAGRMGKLRLLQAVASAGMQTMHERDVALLSARPDVTLLRLQFHDSQPDFFETRRIPEFIRMAKESFPLQLEAIEERLRARDDVDEPPLRAAGGGGLVDA